MSAEMRGLEAGRMGRPERVLSALIILIFILTLSAGAALLFHQYRGSPMGVETAPGHSGSLASDET